MKNKKRKRKTVDHITKRIRESTRKNKKPPNKTKKHGNYVLKKIFQLIQYMLDN